MAEQQLDGGIANAGRVVRVGPHVLRPSSPHSGSIHAFLLAVGHAGFEGVPSPVGIDEDGRERLVFIDGEVPVPPYPDWSQSDTALASIARLLRGLHDAGRGFDARGVTWLGWRPADRPARLRLVADSYGLDWDGRAEMLTAMNDAIARIEAAVRRRVDAGDANVIAMWNRTGGSERYDRRRRWWTDHHDQFATALL